MKRIQKELDKRIAAQKASYTIESDNPESI